MEKLIELEKVFKQFRSWGFGEADSMQKAVNEVFPASHKYIVKNEYDEPILVRHENFILVVGSGIYEKIGNK